MHRDRQRQTETDRDARHAMHTPHTPHSLSHTGSRVFIVSTDTDGTLLRHLAPVSAHRKVSLSLSAAADAPLKLDCAEIQIARLALAFQFILGQPDARCAPIHKFSKSVP